MATSEGSIKRQQQGKPCRSLLFEACIYHAAWNKASACMDTWCMTDDMSTSKRCHNVQAASVARFECLLDLSAC